jgi:hypothetical protein
VLTGYSFKRARHESHPRHDAYRPDGTTAPLSVAIQNAIPTFEMKARPYDDKAGRKNKKDAICFNCSLYQLFSPYDLEASSKTQSIKQKRVHPSMHPSPLGKQ